jgi:TonB family protein
MRRRHRDFSFTIALCGSLAVHALVVVAACETYARGALSYAMAPLDDVRIQSENWIVLRGNTWGDPEGTGTSILASPGETTLLAPQAPSDQPFLSRDPVGAGDPMNLPTESLLPEGTGGASSEVAAAEPVPAPPPQPVLPPAEDQPLVGIGPGAADIPAPAVAIAPAAPPVAAPPAPEPTGTPGSDVPPADPAPKSPSESDPFSILGSATWRNGRLDVKAGRQLTSVRPRLSLAQQIELMSLMDPRIVLRIATDATGKVTDVQVDHSCGSDTIDQTVKVTMFEWWFQPAQDSSGQARADVFLFAISFH